MTEKASRFDPDIFITGSESPPLKTAADIILGNDSLARKLSIHHDLLAKMQEYTSKSPDNALPVDFLIDIFSLEILDEEHMDSLVKAKMSIRSAILETINNQVSGAASIDLVIAYIPKIENIRENKAAKEHFDKFNSAVLNFHSQVDALVAVKSGVEQNSVDLNKDGVWVDITKQIRKQKQYLALYEEDIEGVLLDEEKANLIKAYALVDQLFETRSEG